MKKTLPILITTLLISGCSFNSVNISSQETNTNPPEMRIEEHFVSKDQYWTMWYDKDMTWYYYHITYPEIWINLSFEDDFASFFFTKTDLNQIYKYDNWEINIYSGTQYIHPFIKMYYKDKNISLKETINLNHKELKHNDCILLEEENWIWEEKNFPWENIEIIDIDMSTNNMCSLFSDYEWMNIWFVMNKKYPDKYYMFYYIQWCAPTCEMPNLEIVDIKDL